MQVESFKYSIPYLGLVIYFVLLIIIEQVVRSQETLSDRNRKVIRQAALAGLTLFFGFRGMIGWDWYNYYPAFKVIPGFFRFDAGLFDATDYSKGFAIYISIVKSVWNNYAGFILISSVIDFIILDELIKRYASHSYAFAALLFIIFGGFYLETDLLRNAKGIFLFLLSIRYINEKKLLPFMLLNLAGCTFHLSSFLYLPLYFILNRKMRKKSVIIILLTGLAITLFQVEYIRPFLFWLAGLLGESFTELLEKYLEISAYATGYGITIGLIERVITATIIIIYYDRIIERNNYNLIFINSFIIYLVIFFYFSEIKIIPIRVGGLFSFSYWVLYPAFLEVIQNRNNRSLLLLFIVLYSLVKIEGMTDNVLYRYTNSLFKKDNYEERREVFDSVSDTLFQ